MSIRKMAPLPAPYHSILVRATQYQYGILVEYLTPSIELLRDAKGLTQAQLTILRKPSPGRSRQDVDGDHITRQKKATKENPKRVLVRMRIASSEEKALALPGVRDNLVVYDYPNGRHRAYAQGVGIRIGAEVIERSRPVGRFQRTVEWSATGNLILPNWQKVKADWMVQRAINNTLR